VEDKKLGALLLSPLKPLIEQAKLAAIVPEFL
jgi:hypothetical protein